MESYHHDTESEQEISEINEHASEGEFNSEEETHEEGPVKFYWGKDKKTKWKKDNLT